MRVERQQGDEGLKIQRGVADSRDSCGQSSSRSWLTTGRQNMFVRPGLRWPILDKTLVAWVLLANTEQRGVSPLSVVNMPEWDGVVFGELAQGKWMAGSHGLPPRRSSRTTRPRRPAPPSWSRSPSSTGRRISPSTAMATSTPSFPCWTRSRLTKKSILVMGKRHLWNRNQTSPLPTFVGAIEEARFYDCSLSAEMVAALRPNEPLTVVPVGWWTFEDGTARDSTGHFPMGELHGKARIANGKLILDGPTVIC